MSTGIPTSKREVIANKIRSLLALSKNAAATEHEAMLAAQRASEMMTKYAIATADLQVTSGGKIEEKWGLRRRPFPDAKHVVRYALLSIGRMTDCIPTWDTGGGKNDLVYFGTKMDTEVAHWLVGMLRDAIDRDTAAYVESVKGKVHGKTARVSFSQGMVARLCERLEELKDQQEGVIKNTLGSTALVINKLQERDAKAKDAGVNPKPQQHNKTLYSDAASSEAGKAAGDRVGLNPAINAGAKARELE